jgi:Right handed beta helix region
MYTRLAQIEHFTALPLVSPYYENFAINLPLNATNKANTLISDRYDYLNYMYIGTTAPTGYVLGNIVEHVSGMTYALTGTDAARFAISATGEITLTNNVGLVAGTLSFNVVHNLLGTIPITVPVVSGSSTVSFYDSVNGSDANSGREPHLAKQTLDFTGAQNTRCIRRGSTYDVTIRFGNNHTFRAYGNPISPKPIITSPSPEIANIINAFKGDGINLQGCSNVTIEDLDFRGGPTVERCIRFSNVQNATVKRCSMSGNIDTSNSQGVLINSNSSNFVVRHCEIENYYGDGVYATSTYGTYNDIAYNHIKPPFGGAADCVQVTGEGNFAQRPINFHVHHNILDYGKRVWTGFSKGASVVQETDGYCYEYNIVKGGYFGIASMGSRATIRFNYFHDCRFLNTINNEWGFGQGEGQYSLEHAYLGNFINAANRGMYIGGFPRGGVTTWKRVDTEYSYNTAINCGECFRASENWTGFVTDNVLVNNYNQTPYNTGTGSTLADITGTVTITQTAGVATVLFNKHYLGVGDLFTISGADQAGYNLTDVPVVSTPSGDSFTYAVDSGTVSPATGTITYQKKRKHTTQALTPNTAQAYLGSTVAVHPTITGTCQDGQLLTCNTTAQTGITYTYQWLLNGVKIGGATASTYSIPALTSNSTNRWMPTSINFAEIQCVVTATNAAGMISYIFAKFDNGNFSKRVIA